MPMLMCMKFTRKATNNELKKYISDVNCNIHHFFTRIFFNFYRRLIMIIGSETGVESNDCHECDDPDYKFIGNVIFGIVFALIGLLTLTYFLVWGDLNETLKQIAPVVEATSKK